MIIVVLAAIGLTGLMPKALISTYLSFFPVVVGMVKGLRSPEIMQLDLMRTYNASRAQVFWKLRWPSAMPFLFTSMKVAVAISLVGAIVGELPTGAVAGLGARLLAGSYYGQTVQIWSALVMASVMAAVLVAVVGVAQEPGAAAHGGAAVNKPVLIGGDRLLAGRLVRQQPAVAAAAALQALRPRPSTSWCRCCSA